MSRYNSYKLINEKYSVKLADYEWKLFTKAQAVWLVTYKCSMLKKCEPDSHKRTWGKLIYKCNIIAELRSLAL